MIPMKKAFTRFVAAAGLIFVSSQAFSYDLDLVPDQLQHMTNPMPFSSFAHCWIETSEAKIAIDTKLKKGSGNVNGTDLPVGQHHIFTPKNNDPFDIKAGAFAAVEFKKVATPDGIENKEKAVAHCSWL